MSSRLAGARDKLTVQRVSWPTLSVAPAAEIPSAQTEELRQTLADALAETARLGERLEELEKGVQAREQAGFERGFAEGRALGGREASAQQKPVLDRMARTIADLAVLRSKIRTQSEAGLIRLCLAIAHRILKRELRTDPLALEGIVRAVLARTGSGELLRVCVHPEQAEAVRSQLSQLGVSEDVQIEATASLEEGSLIVETAGGAIDASLGTQIAEVERGLTAHFRS